MILEIFQSFRRLPTWVQLWMVVVLVPVNLASLAFLGSWQGAVIAALAVGGMVPNIFIMMRERGLSNAMTLPHLVLWIPLVVLLVIWLSNGTLHGELATFALLLLLIDGISLWFDIIDAVAWWRGDRAIA